MKNNNPKGILYILVGMAIFSIQDALIKFIYEDTALYELYFGRTLTAIILLTSYLLFTKQKIILNIEVLMTNDSEPQIDNLEHTQDYSQFRKIAKDLVDSQHFDLLEILTAKIHKSINEKNYVIGSLVKISKPTIFNDCEVAYELSNI